MEIEYRAQVLEDDKGNRYMAQFLQGVTKAVQYGAGIKAHALDLLFNGKLPEFAPQLHKKDGKKVKNPCQH